MSIQINHSSCQSLRFVCSILLIKWMEWYVLHFYFVELEAMDIILPLNESASDKIMQTHCYDRTTNFIANFSHDQLYELGSLFTGIRALYTSSDKVTINFFKQLLIIPKLICEIRAQLFEIGRNCLCRNGLHHLKPATAFWLQTASFNKSLLPPSEGKPWTSRACGIVPRQHADRRLPAVFEWNGFHNGQWS